MAWKVLTGASIVKDDTTGELGIDTGHEVIPIGDNEDVAELVGDINSILATLSDGGVTNGDN